MRAAFTADHMGKLRRLGMGGYPCATYAAREIEQLNEYVYALEAVMLFNSTNVEAVRVMLRAMRRAYAPDVDMPELPRMEVEQ